MDDRMLNYSKTVRNKIHSSGLFGRANDSLHRALEYERQHGSYHHVLEIGSGDLEHLAFVRHACNRYYAVDLRAPTNPSARIAERPTNIAAVDVFQMDGTELVFPEATFDRVLATCVIMHVVRPDLALLEWLRVTKPGVSWTSSSLATRDSCYASSGGSSTNGRRSASACLVASTVF